MVLSKEEAKLFFKIYISLLGYANKCIGDNKRRMLTEARHILYDNPQIIKKIISENPDGFNSEEIEIICGWQKFIKGNFILIGSLKKYDAFLTLDKNKTKIYGVVGLTDSPIDLAIYGIGTYFENVELLPWKNKIIWDGFVYQKPVVLGVNYLKSFNEEYKKIKQENKIVEYID